MGWTRGQPCYIAFLARACAIGGQVEEALALWDDALQIVERTQARWFAAELNRHKGRLLLQQGHPEAAEETVSQSPEHRPGAGGEALGTAQYDESRAAGPRPGSVRRGGATSWQPIYGWFIEGLDTPDLKAAKALARTSWHELVEE